MEEGNNGLSAKIQVSTRKPVICYASIYLEEFISGSVALRQVCPDSRHSPRLVEDVHVRAAVDSFQAGVRDQIRNFLDVVFLDHFIFSVENLHTGTDIPQFFSGYPDVVEHQLIAHHLFPVWHTPLIQTFHPLIITRNRLEKSVFAAARQVVRRDGYDPVEQLRGILCQQQRDVPAVTIAYQVGSADTLFLAEVDHVLAVLRDGVRRVF